MMLILIDGVSRNMVLIFSEDAIEEIDVFTQKEPYCGRGPNTPSDSFGPNEAVILFALVTYNGYPRENYFVSFHIRVPEGTYFTLFGVTNASGIATTNFTIPQKCENETEFFGEWFVLAITIVGNKVVQDTLTFKVDYIVKIIQVRTINENNNYQAFFGIEGDVGLEIALKNMAMIEKNVTLAITIQDEVGVPVNFSIVPNFEVYPNEKPVILYCKAYIPKWSHIGKAIASVVPLTKSINEGGIPYSPAVSVEFFITPSPPLALCFHDVAITRVISSARSVNQGQLVNITVFVQNEGTEIESFDVITYFNDTLIENIEVTKLTPYSRIALNFIANTSSLKTGNYTVIAFIPYLTNETDKTDNRFLDGIIEIKQEIPPFIHDIAIVNITISNESLYVGESLHINVDVINEGTVPETFNLSIYYRKIEYQNLNLIETCQIVNLSSGIQATLSFVWVTFGVDEGFYEISAYAEPVQGEIDISDNNFTNGIVRVKTPIHDIALLSIQPSTQTAYIGETITIQVVAKNEGNYDESFQVTVYHNTTAIETQTVNNLTSNSTTILTFLWNTKNITEGNYILSAFATPVQDEEDTEDNYLTNGTITISTPPKGWFIPEWFYWLLILLLLLIFLLIIWLYHRKRKREETEAFHNGWTAWYYGYNLKDKIYPNKKS
ncbi:MAG: CARDB domain-containing protein [Candidatus Bathyarchaeia archaeon]